MKTEKRRKDNIVEMPPHGQRRNPQPPDGPGNIGDVPPAGRRLMDRADYVIYVFRRGSEPRRIAQTAGTCVAVVNGIIRNRLNEVLCELERAA